MRLESYRVEAVKQGIAAKLQSQGPQLLWTEAPPVALVNVRASASYSKSIAQRHAPALLTRSLLYDMRRDRIITIPELFLIQGQPHPHALPLDSSEVELFSFPIELFRQDPIGKPLVLTLAAQRKLIGNAMHRQAVGCWLAYMWLTTDKSSLM